MRFIVKNLKEDNGCDMSDEINLLAKEDYRPLTGSVTDYIEQFYDSNKSVHWRDVVMARVHLLNVTENTCPICMEPL